MTQIVDYILGTRAGGEAHEVSFFAPSKESSQRRAAEVPYKEAVQRLAEATPSNDEYYGWMQEMNYSATHGLSLAVWRLRQLCRLE